MAEEGEIKKFGKLGRVILDDSNNEVPSQEAYQKRTDMGVTNLKAKAQEYFKETFKPGTQAGFSAVTSLKDTESSTVDDDEKYRKYGTFDGVFIRVCVSIFGVLMFLRMGWMVGNVGFFYSVVVVLISIYVTITTTFSASALATNGKVRGGGPYYLVSRSLGIEIGTTMGLIFAFAQGVAIALNTVGFAETVYDSFNNDSSGDRTYGVTWIALIANIGIFITVLFGVDWINKLNLFMVALIIGAFFSFCIGLGAQDVGYIEGFVHPNAATFSSNFMNPPDADEYVFFVVMGVFFPSVTGVMQGVNISGELKDPGYAIPVGTLSAIVFTTIVYVIILALNASSAPAWSLKKNTAFMIEISVAPWLVQCGIYAASLSTAIGLLVGAPRILLAICKDGLFKQLDYFKYVNARNDPVRGYVLFIILGSLVTLIGKLNAIAPIVTNLYMVVYGIVNYACFAAAFSESPGWRPAFRYFNKWHSLSGAIACIGMMFLVDIASALVVIAVAIALYKVVLERKADLNIGGALDAIAYVEAIDKMWSLDAKSKNHVMNFRPQFLIFENLCEVDTSVPHAVPKTIGLFNRGRGVIVIGKVIIGDFHELAPLPASETAAVEIGYKTKAFRDTLICPDLHSGLLQLMQSSGLGKMRPNTIVFEFSEAWRNSSEETLAIHLDALRCAFHVKMGVMLCRKSHQLMANYDKNTRVEADIDVYWLADDGGFSLLMPHLLHENHQWRRSRIRLFVPKGEAGSHETRLKEVTSLIKSLRVEASINLLDNDPAFPSDELLNALGSDLDEAGFEVHQYLQFVPEIRRNSQSSKVVFISLPKPTPTVSPKNYYLWLSYLTQDLPPTILIHGDQGAVMTSYL
eukprot:GILK01000489.1.p1 GENE.GILK01000489.1~~GILK01000489.1.p1  ORF type:complete len:888 (+),score=173.56 GILK01000489.1:90-2666(+)